ncbi:leucine-rich repeat protein [Veillonella parvula]|uniref:leucine-rich repeat protein n=1 Tax=Veillonella parvula TaxID=29466 RepID=UPI0029051B77|nr:leucine-rich repeat protein [Veillonella parvula]MDU3190510.1 leucine-rich repeat protein [Veillonella parvula]MDU6072988.1 leucine-rich repeat protein [Veillonella parvula]
MTQDLNVNITGLNLPPIKLEGAPGKSAYEIWLEAGNTGTREDFLNSLKGTNGSPGLPGKDATADGAYEMLLGLNVYCENSTPNEVLKGLIRGLGDVIKKPFKGLEFDSPVKGQTYINVYGTPHFKVALLGKGAAAGVSIGDDGQARMDLDKPFMTEDIQIEYFNMLGSIVGTYRVSGYNDVKTTIESYEFANTYDQQNYEFPEVTTVGAYAFGNSAKTIKLPKAVRIDKTAFDNCANVTEIYIPNFVMQQGNEFQTINMTELIKLVINEASDVEALSKMLLSGGKIYNQNGTKYFDKKSKTWVQA